VHIALVLTATLVAAAALALALARRFWLAGTAKAVGRVGKSAHVAGDRGSPAVFSYDMLDGLPTPVARYLRLVLREGQPLVRSAWIQHRGTFLIRPPDGWGPFPSTQFFSVRPPGFVWDATIRMGPVPVYVRDAFVDGQGAMLGKVLGLIPVVSISGTADIAAGALHRYLAEAAWFPTALLPGQAVTWTPVDDSTARAHITGGATTVSLDFHFGADGFVSRAYTPDRMRDVNGRGVPTPWQGRFVRWAECDEMLVPADAMVEWLLPDGPLPYYRSTIVTASYNPDRSTSQL
jgi:hypothetical protein